MRIGINASFLRKPGTGIGQVSMHFLRDLFEYQKEVSDKDDFILYLEEDISSDILGALPDNVTKRIFLPGHKRDDLIRKILWEKFLLPKKVQADQCDVFLSLYQSSTQLKDMKHVMLVHDLIPRIFPQYLSNMRKKIYQFFTERAIKKASHVVAVSHHTKNDLHRYLKLQKECVSVTHISVDPLFDTEPTHKECARVKEKYSLPDDYIYTGGGLEVRKNVETTLQAYKILRQKAHTVPDLVISGKLMPELAPLVTDVDQRVRELHIENNVHVLGYVPQEDLPALYANATSFVFPSRYEGFGMPVLESMKVGTPVITTQISSIPEVSGPDGALYCDPDDAKKLAELMDDLSLDKNMQAMYTKKARQRAEQFTWRKTTARILSLLHSI